MRAVADTGPLHYIVLIGGIEIVPLLVKGVSIPETVREELSHPEAPVLVRVWISAPPAWLTVAPDQIGSDPSLQKLDAGEREALRLALAIRADLILMDDRTGVSAARARGCIVTGTLGFIDLAARHGLIDVSEAVSRLRATNFRCRPDLFDALLTRHSKP